jgi:DNA-binding NarL/FixJ family response regulator
MPAQAQLAYADRIAVRNEKLMRRDLRPLHPFASREMHRLAHLRPREWEVLNLLATGATNAEIATSLSLAEGTVRNMVANVTIKLRVADRTQAALLAVREGLGCHELATHNHRVAGLHTRPT